MNNVVGRSLLPVVFALASLGTMACTAEEAGPGDVATSDTSAPASPSPVQALSGAAGESRASAAELPGATIAEGSVFVSTRLTVIEDAVTPSAPVVYDVVGYGFGVDASVNVSDTGDMHGLVANKANLQAFTVNVRPNPTSPLLSQSIFLGHPIDKLVLERVAADGTSVTLATFEHAGVSQMSSVSDGSTLESYAIDARVLTMTQGTARVTVDVTHDQTTCADPCPCNLDGATGRLGPYTQSGLLGAIPKGSTRIDQVEVALHDLGSDMSGTAASGGKPVLDGISFEAPLETSGVCALYYAGRSAHVRDVRLGVAAPWAGGKSAPAESTTWDACVARVSSVSFGSGDASSVYENVMLGAAGLVRTDRTFDASGMQVGKSVVTGWSFLSSTPVASCDLVLP
jgi:hypothetical protein